MTATALALATLSAVAAPTQFAKCGTGADTVTLQYSETASGTVVVASFEETNFHTAGVLKSAWTNEIVSIYATHDFNFEAASEGVVSFTLERNLSTRKVSAHVVSYGADGVINKRNFDECHTENLLGLKKALGDKAQWLAISRDTL